MKVNIFTAPSRAELEKFLNEYLQGFNEGNYVDIKLLYEPRYHSEDEAYTMNEQYTAMIIEKGK